MNYQTIVEEKTKHFANSCKFRVTCETGTKSAYIRARNVYRGIPLVAICFVDFELLDKNLLLLDQVLNEMEIRMIEAQNQVDALYESLPLFTSEGILLLKGMVREIWGVDLRDISVYWTSVPNWITSTGHELILDYHLIPWEVLGNYYDGRLYLYRTYNQYQTSKEYVL